MAYIYCNIVPSMRLTFWRYCTHIVSWSVQGKINVPKVKSNVKRTSSKKKSVDRCTVKLWCQILVQPWWIFPTSELASTFCRCRLPAAVYRWPRLIERRCGTKKKSKSIQGESMADVAAAAGCSDDFLKHVAVYPTYKSNMRTAKAWHKSEKAGNLFTCADACGSYRRRLLLRFSSFSFSAWFIT